MRAMSDGEQVAYDKGDTRRGRNLRVDEVRKSVALRCTDDRQRAVVYGFFATPLVAARWTTDAGMTRLARRGCLRQRRSRCTRSSPSESFDRTELLAVAIIGRTGERRHVATDYSFWATGGGRRRRCYWDPNPTSIRNRLLHGRRRRCIASFDCRSSNRSARIEVSSL
jgi:hypothetical protein